MKTAKQNKANRTNSFKGGVKTEAGKAKSSKNALKHGILSLRVIDGEVEDYSALVAGLTEDYEPRTIVHRVLVERMALIIVQLKRLSWASNEYWQCCLNPEIRRPNPLMEFGMGEIITPGYEPKISSDIVEPLLSLYHRYQTRLENQLIKIEKVLS